RIEPRSAGRMDQRSGRGMGAFQPAVTIEPTLDWTLVVRAREGDPASFEGLYRKNEARVYALCARMCGDRVQAEDLTQEVFVRAGKRVGWFGGEGQFSTWLHRLAVNVVLESQRFQRRRFDVGRATDDLVDAEAERRSAVRSEGRAGGGSKEVPRRDLEK